MMVEVQALRMIVLIESQRSGTDGIHDMYPYDAKRYVP